MSSIHGHEVLSMMEGNWYCDESLLTAIYQKFGQHRHFHTCSQSAMTAEQLIAFLKSKRKFIMAPSGEFTVNSQKVCHHN